MLLPCFYFLFFNPFVPNAPFPENRKVFCFQAAEKRCIGNKWVKKQKASSGTNLLPRFLHDFWGKISLTYILLSDQISLSDCLYCMRYWAICVIICCSVCDVINFEINLSFLVLKRASSTCVFLSILRLFQERLCL